MDIQQYLLRIVTKNYAAALETFVATPNGASLEKIPTPFVHLCFLVPPILRLLPAPQFLYLLLCRLHRTDLPWHEMREEEV